MEFYDIFVTFYMKAYKFYSIDVSVANFHLDVRKLELYPGLAHLTPVCCT